MPNIYGNTEIWGDLLVTGSFSVLGSASSYNTTNLVITNTILTLGATQVGLPILDQGILITRGTGVTQAIIWDESDYTFSLIETDANEFVIGDINILGYSNLRISGLTTSNISITSGASSGYILRSDSYGNANWTDPSFASSNIYNSNGGFDSDRDIYGYGNYLYFDTNSPGYTSSTIGSYLYMAETQAEISAYSSGGGTNSRLRLLDTQIQSFAVVDGWNHNGNLTVFSGDVGINTSPTYRLHVVGTTSTTGFRMTNGASAGYLLQSDASGNGTWISATSISSNFANTNLTFTNNRSHNTNGNSLKITTDGGLYTQSFFEINTGSLSLGNNLNGMQITPYLTVFNSSGYDVDFKIEGDTDSSTFFVDASINSIGIGTASPASKLNLIGDSIFRTSTLTTGTSPAFRFLDGVTTPTDVTNIKSFYKEFRPTTTSSSTVVGDGTIIYPNINSSSSADFYSSANLTLFTGNLSNLSSNEALTGEVNVISISSNTGTYNGVVKSSSSVLRNLTAGGTIDKYVGFWMNGFNAGFTHNGTTNKIYGFYMDDQSGRSGNIPSTSNRWGVYIEDAGNNYFAGSVGLGVISPNYKLEVSGTVSTTGFRMTNGSTNGYFLKSNSSGVGSWAQITASDISGLSGGLTGSGTNNYVPIWTGANVLSSTSSIYISGDNVGIGTTSPTAKLEIQHGSEAARFTTTAGTGLNYVIFRKSTTVQQGYVGYGSAVNDNLDVINYLAADLNLGVDSVVRMTIKTGGNVGIGTTNPQNLLHVLGTNTLTGATIYRKAWIGGAATWGTDAAEELGVGYNGIRSIYSGTADGWDLAFTTGTSAAFNAGTQQERLRIDRNGNVGIGTTLPVYRLEVSGTVSTTGLKMTTSPASGYVLTSDATGNATWQQSSVDIYSSTQAFSAGVSYSITHSLNTNNISVTIWEDTTGDLLTLSTKRLNVNQVQLLSRVSISSATIVIMGGV